MPVRLIGMIGVAPPQSSTIGVIGGTISRDWIAKTARDHENAGFDEVLIGYFSASADGFAVAMHAGAHTQKLSYLIAHRPGRILPALAARKIATMDQLLQGRISMHIIIGGSDADMAEEGDFSHKSERYARGGEYVDIMRRIWTSDQPVDYEGRFYRVKNARSEIKPYQQPHPALLFGGSSPEALDMGAQFCDRFAMFGEPLKETAERIADYRVRCAVHGRQAKFNVSFRPIIADTEGKAWDKAHRILAEISGKAPPSPEKNAPSVSTTRLRDVAARGEIHDERFWTPIAAATGAHGNSTCLVGTPEQVAKALLKYYELGVDSFLLRGFDPKNDVEEFGRELVPMIRQFAAEMDQRIGNSTA